jgi:hypothetical protein
MIIRNNLFIKNDSAKGSDIKKQVKIRLANRVVEYKSGCINFV